MLKPDAEKAPDLLVDYGADVRAEVTACHGYWLFCDGGVIGKNPSPAGGTWAWRLVENDIPLAEASGVLLPAEVAAVGSAPVFVSNNMTELAAMVYGFEALETGACGRDVVPAGATLTVASDSLVTLNRLFGMSPWNNVPPSWRKRAFTAKLAVRRRLGVSLRAVLLDGHPSIPELHRGEGKRGRAVSIHNRWCDYACTEQAAKAKKEAASR